MPINYEAILQDDNLGIKFDSMKILVISSHHLSYKKS